MCYQYQQSHDNVIQIEAPFWRNCSSLFAEDKIVLPKKRLRHHDDSESLGKSAIEVIISLK